MVFIKSDAMKADIAGRKDRIIAAAIAIVTAHGADAATVTAVARRSRVSKALICKYFVERDELLAAAVERVRLRDLVAIEKVLDADDPPGSLARVAAVLYARLASRNLNAFTFASPIYREAIREALARLLLDGGTHGPRSAKVVSAAILGALRGIAEAMDYHDARSRADAVMIIRRLVGVSERAYATA